jgi:hypothetical protein
MMNANDLRSRKVVVGETETTPNKQRLLRAVLRPVNGADQRSSTMMQEDPESEFFVVTVKI